MYAMTFKIFVGANFNVEFSSNKLMIKSVIYTFRFYIKSIAKLSVLLTIFF